MSILSIPTLFSDEYETERYVDDVVMRNVILISFSAVQNERAPRHHPFAVIKRVAPTPMNK